MIKSNYINIISIFSLYYVFFNYISYFVCKIKKINKYLFIQIDSDCEMSTALCSHKLYNIYLKKMAV